MNNIDNFSDSFSTEHNSYHGIQNGGFFWNSQTNTESEKVLNAAKKNDSYLINRLVNNDLIPDYSYSDQDKNTLLHILIKHYYDPLNQKIINNIIKRHNVLSFINQQNADGDTPLILAVKYGHMDLAEKLIAHGANKNIKNNDDFGIESEEVFDDDSVISFKSGDVFDGDSVMSFNSYFNKNNNIGFNSNDNLINALAKKNKSDTETNSIRFTEDYNNVDDYHNNLDDTEDFISKLTDKYNNSNIQSNNKYQQYNTPNYYDQDINNTEKIFEKMINQQQNINQNNYKIDDTENIFQKIIDQNNNQNNNQNNYQNNNQNNNKNNSDNIFQKIINQEQNNNNKIEDTEEILSKMVNKYNNKNQYLNNNNNNNKNVDTEGIMNLLLNNNKKYNTKQNNDDIFFKNIENMYNRKNKLNEYQESAMSAFLQDTQNDENTVNYRNMSGGSRKKHIRNGQRRLRLYNELDVDMNVHKVPKERTTEMTRTLAKQSTEIHEKVIDKIMELLNVDKEKAKVYKSALYVMTKEKYPNISNLERAIEMEKLVKKDTLKKINYEEHSKKIKLHIDNKKNKKNNKNNKNNKKPKNQDYDDNDKENSENINISSTSQESVSEDEYSATSYSN